MTMTHSMQTEILTIDGAAYAGPPWRPVIGAIPFSLFVDNDDLNSEASGRNPCPVYSSGPYVLSTRAVSDRGSLSKGCPEGNPEPVNPYDA